MKTIQIVSFVNPKRVPGMADAEQVATGFTPAPGVSYRALWLNQQGFERARATGRFDLRGSYGVAASDTFLKRNQNRSIAEQTADNHTIIERFKELGVPVERGGHHGARSAATTRAISRRRAWSNWSACCSTRPRSTASS